MTDSFRTNHSDVSVTYTMRCVPDVPVGRLFLPPCQTLSLTNRCRATAHAVMLLPKHFNELTWPHVFRHVVSCLRCAGAITARMCIHMRVYVYVRDYRVYAGNFPTLLKLSPDVSRLTQSNEICNLSLIASPIISYFFKYINKRR